MRRLKKPEVGVEVRRSIKPYQDDVGRAVAEPASRISALPSVRQRTPPSCASSSILFSLLPPEAVLGRLSTPKRHPKTSEKRRRTAADVALPQLCCVSLLVACAAWFIKMTDARPWHDPTEHWLLVLVFLACVLRFAWPRLRYEHEDTEAEVANQAGAGVLRQWTSLGQHSEGNSSWDVAPTFQGVREKVKVCGVVCVCAVALQVVHTLPQQRLHYLPRLLPIPYPQRIN